MGFFRKRLLGFLTKENKEVILSVMQF